MATQFERFKGALEKMLMLDQADLDFGIYRIMNQKRNDIEKYLNNELKKQVTEAVSGSSIAEVEALKKELDALVKTLTDAGMNPEDAPKVKDLRAKLSEGGDTESLENEVYSHLTTFFSRYYDGGDFISQRRYKKDVYAIPYEGEEVKLYWANADQYYIKSGEYFRSYRFTLSDGKAVEFTLKEATVEQNNNIAQDNMERRFALYEELPINVEGDTLHINFTYELYPKTKKQKDFIDKAYDTVKNMIPSEFIGVFDLRPTEKDKNRTLLQKHLNYYVARNTFDYFIHKDLNGFLSRELDFFVKNEILVIDDIDAKNPKDFVQHLSVIKAVKTVGKKIITFLASLEDFQKKLWLKKKFVVQADYCITLDRVPEKLYSEICTNDKQREEWVKLFAIDEIKGNAFHHAYSVPLTEDFLKENPFLVLDTQFFSSDFKNQLLSEIDNIDEQCDGLIINSDNFQALGLLEEKYRNLINYCYIDPPYNTNASEILYKNGYKDSCWLTLMSDRVQRAKKLLTLDATNTVAIDHAEIYNLGQILDYIYGKENRIAIVAVQHNPKGRNQAKFFSENIEFMLEYANDVNAASFNEVAIDDDVLATFTETDNRGKYRWENFVRARLSRTKEHRPDNWYPLYISNDLKIIKTENFDGAIEVWPQVPSGFFTWKNVKTTFDELNKDGYFKAVKEDGLIQVYHKYYENQVLKNLWIDKKYQSEFNGTNIIKGMFGTSEIFSYPKSVYAVQDSIKIASKEQGIVLDYFGGSGTTAHAVINLNKDKEQQEHRKYILCEMGEYFNTVTKPRIQKVIYSKDWNNGKPVSREGCSNCFKYMRLEQYEDTLNNLIVKSSMSEANGEFYDGYMLGYLLDTETKDSLFNLEWFRNPWNTKLFITRNNETKEETIDLIETFNYLIGLNVETILYPKEGICTIEGVTRTGERTLVIWRDVDAIDNESLNKFFEKQAYSTKDSEFDRIYVNGDCNLENLHSDEDSWKVVLTEKEFAKRMFEDC